MLFRSAPAGVRSVPDLAGASGLVEAPTLVIWGERDESFTLACLDGLDHWVPNLTLRRVPEGGHWLLCEQTDRVAAWIADFLAAEA